MKTKLADIIIGCMSWGEWGSKFSTQEMISLLNSCIDEGNTTFDHADIYGGYTTELAFGKAFAESKIRRDKIQVISKCGIQYDTEVRPNSVKHYDYSKEYIIWSVETSLKNLHTDYLDVLLLHRPSPLMQADEISEAVQTLQKQGKIIDFGVSNFTQNQIELLNTKVPVTSNQIEFSLVQHTAIDSGVLDYSQKEEIQTMSWSPLGSFFSLTTDQAERINNLLTDLSEKYNTTKDALLLAWVLKHPAKIVPVIGTTKINRIKNANNAKNINLSLQDWFLLYEASRGEKVA